jgi:hypothetical protein
MTSSEPASTSAKSFDGYTNCDTYDSPMKINPDATVAIMIAYGTLRGGFLASSDNVETVNSTHAFTMYNALAVTLRRAGFDAADTLHVITVFDCFVLGSALDLAAPEEPWESGVKVGPELAAALATGAPKPDRADDAFEYGLAVLLRGLTVS